MLGFHDFCGHYDWTFHYIRRQFGQDAVHELWADAIGHDSQQHYRQAGARDGLRGLYNTWVQTGEDEGCDWTFTLDESRNVLRWDMRQCPSKGFLLQNDLHADEDYCDHCMGWMIPMAAEVGVEIAVHEHNHCGQCWGEMHVKGKPYQSLNVACDIRQDPRFRFGHLDRWQNNRKVALTIAGQSHDDSATLIERILKSRDRLALLADNTASNISSSVVGTKTHNVLVTHQQYAQLSDAIEPHIVLIGRTAANLTSAAERYHATPPERQPLLVHTYLPNDEPIDFVAANLPRPLPLLPWLIRSGVYRHQPHQAHPDDATFLRLLAQSADQPIDSLPNSAIGSGQ